MEHAFHQRQWQVFTTEKSDLPHNFVNQLSATSDSRLEVNRI
jgi:hypothetical protein